MSTSTTHASSAPATSTPSNSGASSSAGELPVTAPVRPSVPRRAALAATTALASVLPVVWGVGTAVEMATGTEADHVFHQVVGQGLLLSALWLGALWPSAVAGWRGRRPTPSAALHTAAFVVAAVAASAMSPVSGGPVVSAYLAVTASLLWLALPARPRLRGVRLSLDPVAAPVVALLSGLHVSFAVTESALQRAMADEHATMAHNFDMAWVSLTLVLLGVAATLEPSSRRLLLWTGAGSVVVGLSRLLVTGEVWWSVGVTALGALAAVLVLLGRRDQPTR